MRLLNSFLCLVVCAVLTHEALAQAKTISRAKDSKPASNADSSRRTSVSEQETDVVADCRRNADDLYAARKFHQALSEYQHYLAISKTEDPMVLYRVGNCAAFDGQRNLEIESLQRAVALWGDSLNGYLARCDLALSLFQYRTSLKAAKAACKRFPNEWKTWQRLGFTHQRFCEFEQAIQPYSRALELRMAVKKNDKEDRYPSCTGDQTLYRLYALRAHCYYRVGDYKKSIADCSRYIEIRPETPVGYEARGEALMRLADYPNALADFSRATRLKTERPRTFKQMGLCELRLGKYADARSNLSHAIQLFPRYGEAFYLRSQALAKLGDRDAANDDADKADLLGYYEAD